MEIVENKVYRCANRDIIKVLLDNGTFQPFYKSSGKNSGKKDEWLPFDGILCHEEFPLWFHKSRYKNKENPEYHRYGTPELKDVSEKLGDMEIREGTEATCSEINAWLGYPENVVQEELEKSIGRF